MFLHWRWFCVYFFISVQRPLRPAWPKSLLGYVLYHFLRMHFAESFGRTRCLEHRTIDLIVSQIVHMLLKSDESKKLVPLPTGKNGKKQFDIWKFEYGGRGRGLHRCHQTSEPVAIKTEWFSSNGIFYSQIKNYWITYCSLGRFGSFQIDILSETCD